MDKATISFIQGNSLCITYNKESFVVSEDDFKRLIDSFTTKEHFIKMAKDMTEDFLKMEDHDWDINEDELRRKLSVIYENISSLDKQ